MQQVHPRNEEEVSYLQFMVESIKKGFLFYRSLILLIVLLGFGFLAFFAYTYNRSFLVHQETIWRVHQFNKETGLLFVYNIETSLQGTRITPVFPPCRECNIVQEPKAGTELPGTVAPAAADVPIPSPLEQLDALYNGGAYFPAILLVLCLFFVIFFVIFRRKNLK